MAGWYPVGAIHWSSNYGSGDEGGPEFIQGVDRRDPQVHEVWNSGEYGVTSKVHLTARVEIGAEFVSEFATN